MDFSHDSSRVFVAGFNDFDIVYNTKAGEIQSMFRGDNHFHLEEQSAATNKGEASDK